MTAVEDWGIFGEAGGVELGQGVGDGAFDF